MDELGFVPLSPTGALLDRLTHHVHILETNSAITYEIEHLRLRLDRIHQNRYPV